MAEKQRGYTKVPRSLSVTGVRAVPRHVDSVEKLADHLALMAKVPVVYNGKRMRPHPPSHIVLSPSLLREFRCHVGCTACCNVSITLDFTDDEFQRFLWRDDVMTMAHSRFRRRYVTVNGHRFPIMSYPQYKDPRCPFLRPIRDDGVMGCGFWTSNNSTQPLECSSAPQVSIQTRGADTTVIMKRPFGRAWIWKVPPQCEFDPLLDTPGDLTHAVNLSGEITVLRRYQYWADFFRIPTHIPAIIATMQHLKEHIAKDGVHLVKVF